MKFTEFIKNTDDIWKSNKSVCFIGDEYPLLFFPKFFEHVQAKPTVISVDSTDTSELVSTLSQSFLGETKTYFFGELKDTYKKKNTAIIDNGGLHKLIFFLKKTSKFIPSNKNAHIIELEMVLDKDIFILMAKFLGKSNILKKRALIDIIFKRSKIVSLENACRLYDYLSVINANAEDEFNRYLSFLLDPEKSFFTLSNHFFARNKQSFFKIWRDVHEDYSPLFWITYWGEQVWRAYYVCKFLESDDHFNAKRVSARLPFSFTKSYWKNFSLKELQAEHDFLYKGDCAFKKGSNFPLIELFYSKHFSKQF